MPDQQELPEPTTEDELAYYKRENAKLREFIEEVSNETSAVVGDGDGGFGCQDQPEPTERALRARAILSR